METLTRLLALAGCLLLAAAASAAEPAVPAGTVIDNDASWKGRVKVEGPVTVAGGAVLTILPGTTVLFRKGAGLAVEGTLLARGTPETPVVFASAEESPARGDWAGIRFVNPLKTSFLANCSIRNAGIGLTVVGATPDVRDCGIENGGTGISVMQKSGGVLVGNVIRDMSDAGIGCQQGAFPTIERNVFRGCRSAGVYSSNNSSPLVRGNTFEDCGAGLVVSGTVPPVEGNTFRGNKAGMIAVQCGDRQVIRSNRFEENGTGLRCENFSGPVVERNRFTGNEDAVYCYQVSSPLLRNNEITGNVRGIACSRLSAPAIVANDISGNRKGIHLTLSSYAAIHGNNLHGNGIQVELDNMSSDWERKVGRKPERGAQMQLANRISRGLASRDSLRGGTGDGAILMDAVDATGNWWGEKDTAEMESKGAEANIGGLIDYYDVPVRTYEGFPGEYVQDRIRYDGWKKSRIPDAGIPGKGKEAGG